MSSACFSRCHCHFWLMSPSYPFISNMETPAAYSLATTTSKTAARRRTLHLRLGPLATQTMAQYIFPQRPLHRDGNGSTKHPPVISPQT
ncbi:hypothetical protein HBI56_091280 [Parastagonospora nodorum]|uniref:Uncharacterized protein n=1 Tax=Phaeosphaeria nodorum (strain SN15 / ATCC MYA-4574 / FGSC 10173) TaxID=321614 RepID=A0A7U2FHK4_PHANO|nr:hypothetical protein HBH56_108160 [Parastagonospora nodorum]QRD03175.1 hypothetical protein JI435_099430 [Parastagonospora nodorum SN15]KAH3922294.1 hypothetical protein HBH54_225260 [Parastagonospora nodorum]KAH3950967.1 hypothetical protein HBH53_063940 [Parastagonospora nodorum]KAH3979238.1 hypothetical protein HBH52_102310 [Parastagonospora nodorum]